MGGATGTGFGNGGAGSLLRWILIGTVLGLVHGAPLLAAVHGARSRAATPATSVLDRSMKRIDGSEQNLGEYKGKVVLLVNVAKGCGLTPQYDELEALYRRYRDLGFVVLGFPANDFASDVPGSDAGSAASCVAAYDVEFPMFSNISVKGADMHPLYRELTSQPPPIGGEVKWDFQKFLLDRSGKVVAEFDPQVTPEDPVLVGRIEALLR